MTACASRPFICLGATHKRLAKSKYPLGETHQKDVDEFLKDELAPREAAEFAKISVAGTRWVGKSPGKDKSYVIEFASDGTFHMTLDYFGNYTVDGPWKQNHLEIKGHDLRPTDGMPGMHGADVNLTLTPDGQRMEGEWHKKNGKKYGLITQRQQ
jgi:hypothetical protein